MLRRIFQRKTYLRKTRTISADLKAINWIKNNVIHGKGIALSSKRRIVYPEVTGYTIPTLYRVGEKQLAQEMALWLIAQQNKDGSFCGTDGKPYVFDTAQVMRGFLAVLDDLPQAKQSLTKGCDWIVKTMNSDGRPESYHMAGITEYVLLYALPPLLEAGERFGNTDYIETAAKNLQYYRSKPDLIEFSTLSHFHGYIMEALVDLGEPELPKKGMVGIAALQRKDGFVPAYHNVDWLCTPGLAQLAIVFYKVGMTKNGDAAVEYLERIQNHSGGFFGSYGKRASYFEKEEIGWAAKFFIDAYQLKIRSFFDGTFPDIAPATIDEHDGRVQEILSSLGDLNGKRVLDVGCGKGRFARVLKNKFPAADVYGLDFSEELLKTVPEDVRAICGNMMDIRFPDDYFDAIYCVEALEHAADPPNAIREMCRVLKINGKIIIIDKNIKKLGYMRTQPWEKWFSEEEIGEVLDTCSVRAISNFIPYGKGLKAEGLFIAWKGSKHS